MTTARRPSITASRAVPVTAAVAFVAVAVAVTAGWTGSLDRHWHRLVVAHRVHGLDAVARACTDLGWTPVAYLVVGAAALVTAVAGRDLRAALVAVAALVVGQLVRTGLCTLLDRSRPPRADWLVDASGRSFPSGHTTTAVLAWGIVALLACRRLPSRAARRAVGVVAVVAAGLVGASRVYLGVHWPTDVLGGWLLGTAMLGVVVALLPVRGTRPRPA